ncbi:MAG: redoxin domain-containing protein [Candidatus Delongbacteria bacterium]
MTASRSLVLLALALACAGPSTASYFIGDEPPDFTCDDTAGTPWTLSEQRGKVVLINFGQTASQPCDSSFAHLQPDFVAAYDPAVFSLVHIDAANQSAQELIDYWSAYDPQFPILTQCGELLTEWGDGFVPHTVILDPLGIVRGNWIGFYPAFWPQMHTVIEAAINPTGLYVAELELSLTTGDGDEILEPGEAGELLVTLENLGGLAVGDVQATLLSETEWASVTQSASAFPDFALGASHVGDTAFSLSIDADAPAALDAPFRLHLSTSLGEAELRFNLEVGRRTPYWTHDAESATDEWTHSPTPTWTDNWHLSTESSSSPTHAWKAGSPTTGNYSNHADCRLVSPALELLDWSRLNFRHRMAAEVSTAFPDSAYDGGIVEISTDDGANWEQLFPMTPYNKAFRALSGGGSPATHNFAGQTPCYSGVFPWEDAVFDLAAYNGQTVRLAFHFGSDNGGSLEGWYVDDLELVAPQADSALPGPTTRPADHALLSAWPNPFNPSTRVELELPQAGPARLELYDLQGRRVRSLHSGPLAAGRHELRVDGAGLASGLYVLRLETPRESQHLKLLLLR